MFGSLRFVEKSAWDRKREGGVKSEGGGEAEREGPPPAPLRGGGA